MQVQNAMLQSYFRYKVQSTYMYFKYVIQIHVFAILHSTAYSIHIPISSEHCQFLIVMPYLLWAIWKKCYLNTTPSATNWWMTLL